MQPLKEKWRKIDEQYAETENMDKKVILGRKTNKIYKQIGAEKLDFIKENADNIAGLWVTNQNMYLQYICKN